MWTENKNILITPDGSTLVYTVAYQGSKRIYARALNDLEAKEIPAGLDERFIRPFISPDGTRIGFFGLNRQDMLAEREAGERGEEYFHPGARLKVVSLTDGEIATLCAPCGPYIGAGRGAAGGTWAPDGTIVFADGSRLMRISEGGGEPQVIPTAATEYPRGSYFWPSFLPGGKWVLVTIRHGRTVLGAQIAVVHSETGESRILIDNGANARYVPTGHLLFVRDGDIWAVAFDLEELAPTGEQVPVVKGVRTWARDGEAQFTVSETGTLAYQPGPFYSRTQQVVFVDYQDNAQLLLEDGQLLYGDLRYSPDGTKMAIPTLVGADFDMWIHDLERGTHVSIRRPGTDETSPVWTPNGSRIAFSSLPSEWPPGPDEDQSSRIHWAPANGSRPSGNTEIVSMDRTMIPTSWSPDGKTIAYFTSLRTSGAVRREQDIWTVPADGGASELFLENAIDPMFSPDGLWLAYVRASDLRVFVTSYPGRQTTVEIPSSEGEILRWSPDGRELYYSWENLWRVPILSEPGHEPDLTAGTPQQLPVTTLSHAYDVSPDGRGCAFTKRAGGYPTSTEIVVVLNWFEELKRLVPTGQ